jgi:hypothetical protein
MLKLTQYVADSPSKRNKKIMVEKKHLGLGILLYDGLHTLYSKTRDIF